MLVTGGVGVVLREGSVADDEQLDVVEEAVGCPECVALVTVDLVEGFAKVDSASFEFDVDEGETVDEDGDVVAAGSCCSTVTLVDFILVDDL